MRVGIFLGVSLGLGLGLAGAAPAASAPSVLVGPGTGYVTTGGIDDLTACSFAAVGYDSGGRLVGLTAGHCVLAPGLPVTLIGSPAAGPVGKTVIGHWGPDYGVIELDPEKVIPVASTGGVTVTDIGPAAPGQQVCKRRDIDHLRERARGPRRHRHRHRDAHAVGRLGWGVGEWDDARRDRQPRRYRARGGSDGVRLSVGVVGAVERQRRGGGRFHACSIGSSSTFTVTRLPSLWASARPVRKTPSSTMPIWPPSG